MLTGEEILKKAGVRLVVGAPALVRQDRVEWDIISTVCLASNLYEVAIFAFEPLKMKGSWKKCREWARFQTEEEALKMHRKALRKIRAWYREQDGKVQQTVKMYP